MEFISVSNQKKKKKNILSSQYVRYKNVIWRLKCELIFFVVVFVARMLTDFFLFNMFIPTQKEYL